MPDGEGWDRIEYAYDAAGRRIEKKVDGATQVKYVYDGDHILAEYNGSNTLLRKYVHGPCVDEPICMIEAGGTYAGTHYYHYDALGSCVAMTNSAGNVTQLYEYSVYGQVAASDADHPNRFMFTGREFDKDTGLYYYRARYYHPEIGRFLQTDPIGYGDGMNWYVYCGSNPLNRTDPRGLGWSDPHPGAEWAPANGRVLILPYRLDPRILQMCSEFSEYMKIVEEVFDKVAPDTPVTEMVKKYLEALTATSGALPGVTGNDKNGWRVFIEVDRFAHLPDPQGSYQWRLFGSDEWYEVRGLSGWDDVLGYYPAWEDAVQAGRNGVVWWNWTNGACFNQSKPPASANAGSIEPTWGGDYRYTGGAFFITAFYDPNTKQPAPLPKI
jgi:RHS repeat-associated protein